MRQNKFFHEIRSLILEELTKTQCYAYEYYTKQNTECEKSKKVLEEIKNYHQNYLTDMVISSFNPSEFIQNVIRNYANAHSDDENELRKIRDFQLSYKKFTIALEQFIAKEKEKYIFDLNDEMKIFVDKIQKGKQKIQDLKDKICFVPFDQNVEICENGAIRPYYTIYQTNFNPTYFGDMQSINSKYLSNLFSLIYDKEILHNNFILKCYNEKLENYIPTLVELEREALVQNIFFNSRIQHPSLALIEKSIPYRQLKETRDMLLQKLVLLEKSDNEHNNFYSDLKNTFKNFEEYLINYKEKVEKNTSLLINQSQILSGLDLQLNIYNFIKSVFEKQNIKEDEYHSLINDLNNVIDCENDSRKRLMNVSNKDNQDISINEILDILDNFEDNSKKLNDCLFKVDKFKKEIDDIYQNIKKNNQNRSDEEENLLLEKEREELAKKNDILLMKISEKKDNLSEYFKYIDDSFCSIRKQASHLSLSKTFKDKFPKEKPLNEWKANTLLYLKNHEKYFKKKLKKLNAKINKLQNSIDNESKDNETNSFKSLVTCTSCGQEVSHCLTKCGHLFCLECIYTQLRKHGKCRICSTPFTSSDVVPIAW